MTRRPPTRLLGVLALGAVSMATAQPAPTVRGVSRVVGPVTPKPSRQAVRDLPTLDLSRRDGLIRHVPRRRPDLPLPRLPEAPHDRTAQRGLGEGNAPELETSFDGVPYTGFVPPDTVGDVGPDHYVQMVNTVFQIWDKDGTVLAGPTDINELWDGAGGNCEAQNAGDPIVLYDLLADRWLISQFAHPASECIAISATADPTGSYHLYEFDLGVFPDYPKLGVWPDAYYMGANSNPRAFAFDRTKMLANQPATAQGFDLNEVYFHSMLLPADLDGPTSPPAGSPGIFHRFIDSAVPGGGSTDRLELFELQVDFADPDNSSFTGPTSLPVTPFASLCNFSFDCIRQPGTSRRLDSITEWPMFRFQYRNFGTHQTLVGNHSVNVGGNQSGVRWFELRDSGGGWSIHQQGTFAPDDDSRWMGSIAMDGEGNIALGYNVSSTATFPSLRFTGRMDGDGPGLMTLGEGSLAAGGGSQTGINRWGDYSALSVDPADDCTFWFTGEYYQATASADWKTKVGSFRLCSEGPPEVAIVSPPDGATVVQSELIGFLGAATDEPDGDLSANLDWTSSLDGAIGTGEQFLSTLSLGSHTITASVSDSDANPGSDSVDVTIIASGCSDYLALNQEVSGDESTTAGVGISGWPGFRVVAGGHARLTAGERVVLRDGSVITADGLLSAEIDPGAACP